MNGADLGAGQHREEDLGDPRQIDGDDVTLVHAHGLEDVRHLLDFAVEGEVGEGAHLVGVLTDPDESQLVPTGGIEVTVHRIGDDVRLGTGEPLEEGLA